MFASFQRATLATAFVVAISNSVFAATCTSTYNVVSGDNCVAIANKFGITSAALISANSAINSDCSNLFVGEQLCIPAAPIACQAQYTVVSGDNCVALAAKFNVTNTELHNANPSVNSDCSNLFVGEQLCIPAPPANCSSQYSVVVGDTCATIASKFSVTSPALIQANPTLNSDCSNLFEGEILCIPKA